MIASPPILAPTPTPASSPLDEERWLDGDDVAGGRDVRAGTDCVDEMVDRIGAERGVNRSRSLCCQATVIWGGTKTYVLSTMDVVLFRTIVIGHTGDDTQPYLSPRVASLGTNSCQCTALGSLGLDTHVGQHVT